MRTPTFFFRHIHVYWNIVFFFPVLQKYSDDRKENVWCQEISPNRQFLFCFFLALLTGPCFVVSFQKPRKMSKIGHLLLMCLITALISKKVKSGEIVYQKIEDHKGTLLTEKIRLQTADAYYRIRFDIPLQEWSELKKSLMEIQTYTNDPQTMHTPLTIFNEDLQRTINRLNPTNLIRKLRGQIQPTLSFKPEETIADPLTTTGMDKNSNTYYLQHTCEHLIPMAATADMKSRMIILPNKSVI